jgi:hypothetical protein
MESQKKSCIDILECWLNAPTTKLYLRKSFKEKFLYRIRYTELSTGYSIVNRENPTRMNTGPSSSPWEGR